MVKFDKVRECEFLLNVLVFMMRQIFKIITGLKGGKLWFKSFKNLKENVRWTMNIGTFTDHTISP